MKCMRDGLGLSKHALSMFLKLYTGDEKSVGISKALFFSYLHGGGKYPCHHHTLAALSLGKEFPNLGLYIFCNR